MGKLIYSAIASLDGYVADETGNFDWAEPDEEVHAFVNELERRVGTRLLGRRLYEVMRFWDTITLSDQPPFIRDLASHAFTAGLVDEVQLFLAPIVLGGGTQSLPDHVREKLELLDERRFANGVVHLHYRIAAGSNA